MQSAAGAAAYRDSVRVRFRRVLGPLRARTPLRAQVTGKLKRVGFHIEKVIYESTPHHHVTVNLSVPTEKVKKPGVLLFCGHEQESKATVSYQKTATLLVQHGFVVWVIDPISQGERMQLTAAAVELRASGRAVVPALHAAVLWPASTRLRVDKMPPANQQLLAQPTTKNVYSEVLPGVLRHYDLPDLQRALGDKLVVGETPTRRIIASRH